MSTSTNIHRVREMTVTSFRSTTTNHWSFTIESKTDYGHDEVTFFFPTEEEFRKALTAFTEVAHTEQ